MSSTSSSRSIAVIGGQSPELDKSKFGVVAKFAGSRNTTSPFTTIDPLGIIGGSRQSHSHNPNMSIFMEGLKQYRSS
jgi:hypothetical protein